MLKHSIMLFKNITFKIDFFDDDNGLIVQPCSD